MAVQARGRDQRGQTLEQVRPPRQVLEQIMEQLKTGKGLTAGTQSPLGYLPIAESDFVFAGLAEDLGFIGAAILFLLYIALLVAALRIAFRARDPFGMLLGSGIVAMLLFQILVNVGMAISLMPVTGIPLPFISHGGSSLVSILFALGVLQSIAMRREAPALG